MKTHLSVHARDLISWRDTKTAVLAILMHVIQTTRLDVIEDDTGLRIEMKLNNAVKSMEKILQYFRDHYEGQPLNLNIEVQHSEKH